MARLAPSLRLLVVSLCGCCPDLSGRDVYIGWLSCTMALSSVVDGCLLSSVVAVAVDDCLYRSLFGGEGSGWCLVAPLPVFDVAVVMLLLGLCGLLLS